MKKLEDKIKENEEESNKNIKEPNAKIKEVEKVKTQPKLLIILKK